MDLLYYLRNYQKCGIVIALVTRGLKFLLLTKLSSLNDRVSVSYVLTMTRPGSADRCLSQKPAKAPFLDAEGVFFVTKIDK